MTLVPVYHPLGFGQRALYAGHVADVLADQVEVKRRAHDDRAVTAQNGDGVGGAETEAAEQVVEIAEADRTGDHAQKASVRAGDAPAQHDSIGAAMQHRPADVEAGVRLVAVNLEIILVAAVFRRRIQRRGVDGQSPFGVEHLDRAKMPGGRRMVEQDQLPDRLADLLDLRHHHAARDCTQRQVVKLDVAADVGVDRRSKVFEGLVGQRFLAAPHVEQHAGADRGEADHGDHGRDDQQLGG